jgi:probable F420-dependent oxidoreductase
VPDRPSRPPTAARPFRFLAEPREFTDGKGLAAAARRAEAMGIDVLVISDHLVNDTAPIPSLATVAAATERLRICAFVLNNDLRHPAVLAQDLATLDVLSGGRLEVGIGAGWNRPEYDAIGLPFDPVGVRVARLAEAIGVIKGCFGDGPFSFRGEHYTISEHDGRPKPVQRPHPPFFIGGGGRRLLTLAAREADTISLAPRLLPGQRGDPRSITLAATEEKIRWVRDAAGDRFERIELNIYPTISPVLVTDRALAEAEKLAGRIRERTEMEVEPRELLEAPNIFIGSIDGLVEKFRALRERLGISSIMVGDLDQLAPVVERLADG